MDENSVFVLLSIINECGAILIICPNCLFLQKKIILLMLLDNCYLRDNNALKQP